MKKFGYIMAIAVTVLAAIFGMSYLIQVWLILDWNPIDWTKRERGQVLVMPVIGVITAIVISIFAGGGDDNDDFENTYGY